MQLGEGWCNLVQIGATSLSLVKCGGDFCKMVQAVAWALVGATWFILVQLGADC